MIFRIVFITVLYFELCTGRKHHLEVRDDVRRYIALSTFGFNTGGILDVKLTNFRIEDSRKNETFGLTLDKALSDGMNPFIDDHQDSCILKVPAIKQGGPIAYLTMDFNKQLVSISCSTHWENLYIYREMPPFRMDTTKKFQEKGRRRNADGSRESKSAECIKIQLPMVSSKRDGYNYFNVSFVMLVLTEEEEGLYNLYFHSCPNYRHNLFALNFDIDIKEMNQRNYLSAGDMPLPALYFMMSLIFFLSGLFWIFLLKKSTHTVFRIHYIMGVLVFLKSFSLMFHSINFHFIEVKGEHIEAWAILYYITHLLKGAVLFITIVLIGTGWTFIKHILADKDKKLFMIVIPLQILANVAEIIIAESEEGDIERRTWTDIFTLVDLICCGAILFPVVWSIRHLQEASSTDGKAAINLKKLQLFRQFYIMIVCYIYFTRIIVYLLKATVPFQYVWLDEMFKETATYIFYVLTAYKFRPVPRHPYFVDDSDDEVDDETEAITESGLTQGLHNTKAKNRTLIQSTINELTAPTSKTITTAAYDDGNEDEMENLITKRESSHEYD